MSNDVLGDFLQTRRARLLPSDVGMPEGPARRVPGLRREEVAELAGISTSWYTLLEQGQRTDISADVLRGLARALQLNSHETVYLFMVARETIPIDCLTALGNDVGHTDALESIARTDYLLNYDESGVLVYATEGLFSIVGSDSRATARGERVYRRMFLQSDMRERFAAWETQADHAVAVLRYFTASNPALPSSMPELLAIPEFNARWTRHDVHSDIGWRPENVIVIPGGEKRLRIRSFGFMVPGGGRVIYYFGATAGDARRMRDVSRRARENTQASAVAGDGQIN